MPHLTHSVIAAFYVLLATWFCYLSFRQYQKNNFKFSAWLLVAAAFSLRFFMASDLYLHEWDERYHALVAKNLMQNFLLPKLYPEALLPYDYTSWSSNFIWLHKQPVPLWCMAISMKIFGVNEIALRLPSVIVSSIAVYATYFIGKHFFDERTGLLAAFFHAVNGLVLDVTTGRAATDHIDIFFLFFVELAVVFALLSSLRKRTLFDFFTGICIGLAVLCKWLPAFVVLPVWAVVNYHRRNTKELMMGALIITATAVVVFLPWQIYMQSKFPLEYADTMLHNYRHMVEALDNKGGSIFYFFAKLHINVNEIFWPAFVWFCYRLYQRDHVTYRAALIVWMLLPFLFFSVIETKMQAYLLFVFPALFIMLADFCFFLLQPTASRKRDTFQKILFAAILILSVRFSLERIKPLQDQSKNLAWAHALKELNKTNQQNVVFVHIKHHIEGMFYTNAVMYNYVSPEQINELRSRGYEVIVNTNPDL